MSKNRIVLIKYFKDGLYDRDSIEEIRIKFKNMNLNFDRRKALLDLAIIPLLEGDNKYLSDILEEDKKLKKDYPVASFDYIRKIFSLSITQEEYNYKNIIKSEETMKKHKLLFIDAFANRLLGFKYLEDKKYYQAINYLLEALDITYRLIKDVPDRDLQINYIKSRRVDMIKLNLSETVYNAFGIKLNCLYIKDLYPSDSIEKYFDLEPLLKLINDEEFAKATETSYNRRLRV
jgi:hypothetical protein